tara:strand:- start:6147 stop:6710 length:564 start_codon:yes stop_codon:yes gene_type:complete
LTTRTERIPNAMIETTSFELNYTSKNLNNYHVYKETDTKQERNHKKKMNQKMSKDSDTIEVRQSNGKCFCTNQVYGYGDITVEYNAEGVSEHNDKKKKVKCIMKVDNYKSSPQGILSSFREDMRVWYCRGLVKTGKPIVISDSDGKNEITTNKKEIKNCFFRVFHQNAKSFESRKGARTILEIVESC